VQRLVVLVKTAAWFGQITPSGSTPSLHLEAAELEFATSYQASRTPQGKCLNSKLGQGKTAEI
jgi:hypothetical protein